MEQASDISVPARMRAAHGCSLLGWGTGALFLFLTGAFRIPAVERTPIPAYVFALAAVYAGFRQWRNAFPPDASNPVSRRVWGPVVLMLYLAPFYHGWLRLPHVPFFLVHVFVMAAAGFWLLVEINRTGARLAERLGFRALGTEMSLFGLGVLAVGMAIPVFAVYAVGLAAFRQESLYAVSFALLYPRSRLWLVPALIPLSLTLTSCWRLRRAALSF